jgi:hypothetical protein
MMLMMVQRSQRGLLNIVAQSYAQANKLFASHALASFPDPCERVFIVFLLHFLLVNQPFVRVIPSFLPSFSVD